MNASPPFSPWPEAAKSAYRARLGIIRPGVHASSSPKPVNVNKKQRDHYRMEPQRLVTRTEIWDMEARKAWDPRKVFIPYVVSEAALRYGRGETRRRLPVLSRLDAEGLDRRWLRPRAGGFLHQRRRAGGVLHGPRAHARREEQRGASGRHLQPIFHVERWAGGSEDEPLNIWSIVLLTPQNDPRYEEPFKQMVRAGLLSGFIEIYIQRDWGEARARRLTAARSSSEPRTQCRTAQRAEAGVFRREIGAPSLPRRLVAFQSAGVEQRRIW